MLSFDVIGSIGAVEFWHNDAIRVKVDVMAVLMVMSIVVVVAHCPALGAVSYTHLTLPTICSV